MPDLSTQVAGYMDRVVERVDVEDVAAQVAVRRRPTRGGLPARTKWAWALAGAGTVFAVVGAVAVLGWLVRPGIRVFGSGGGGSATDLPGSAWILAAGGAAGGAVLAAGTYVMTTALRARSKRREGAQMQTLEQKQAEVPTRPRRWPLVGLVVLIVVGLGFGTWWLVDEYTGVDHEIDVLLDEYTAAWNAGDGEAVLGMMNPGRMIDGDGTVYVGEELATYVRNIHNWYEFTVEPAGAPVMLERAGGYDVLSPARMDAIGASERSGVAYFRIVEIDGELKIVVHHQLGG